jgi:hypothetical protein
MRTIAVLLATLIFLAGCGFSVYALYLPNSYRLGGASAVQISQVYDTASYYALLGIAAFAGALVLVSSTKNSD